MSGIREDFTTFGLKKNSAEGWGMCDIEILKFLGFASTENEDLRMTCQKMLQNSMSFKVYCLASLIKTEAILTFSIKQAFN